MRESAGRFRRCRVCAPAFPPDSGPLRPLSGGLWPARRVRGGGNAGHVQGVNGRNAGGARAREGIGGALGRALVGWQLPGRRRGAVCFVPPELENWGWRVCRPDTMGGRSAPGLPPSLRSGTGARGGPGRVAGRGGGASACHRRAGRSRASARAGRARSRQQVEARVIEAARRVPSRRWHSVVGIEAPTVGRHRGLRAVRVRAGRGAGRRLRPAGRAASSRRDGGAGAWRTGRGNRAVPAEPRACAWRTGLATEVECIRTVARPYRPDSIEADPLPVDRARSGSGSRQRAMVRGIPARCLTGVSPCGRPECDGRDRPVRSPDVPRNRASNTVLNREQNATFPQEIVSVQYVMQDKWRMGWDSNPRGTRAPAGFQDRCLRPLGHPSVPRYHQPRDGCSRWKRSLKASWPIGGLLCYRARDAAPVPGRLTNERAPGARGRGGIGRRAWFRTTWLRPWGFESLRPHQRRRTLRREPDRSSASQLECDMSARPCR